MQPQPPLLDMTVLVRTFAAILALVLVGFILAQRYYGSLAVRDVVGTLISALIAAYLVHLWIIMARADGSADR